MAHSSSEKKDIRRTKKRTLVNLRERRDLKELIKKATAAIEAKHADAPKLVKETLKAIDKAAQHGLLKKNTAARKKSHLARALNASVK